MAITRTSVLTSLALMLAGGLALAGDVDTARTARALTRDGVPVGWTVRAVPPDPLCQTVPPDPFAPPGTPCKERLELFVDADRRTDLDQQVVLRHTDSEGINPCIRVLHRFFADGSMAEDINLIDPADRVRLTVPAGYVLVQQPDGSY